MIAQQNYPSYASVISGFLSSRQVWIRIIYITERIQQLTLYCCSLRITESAGQGFSQLKVLVQNKSLESSLAWLACGVRNLRLQECF